MKKNITIVIIILFLFLLLVFFVSLFTSPSPIVFFINTSKTTYKHHQDKIFNTYKGVKALKCSDIFGKQWQEYLKTKDKTNNQSGKACQQFIKDNNKKAPITIDRLPDMNVPRINPKAILLKDGRVLIIGGDGKNLETAEIYNPKIKAFTLIPGNISKYYQTPKRHFYDEPYDNNTLKKAYYTEPILLSDGKVYYLGAIFDPQSNQFYKAQKGNEKKLLDFVRSLNNGEFQNSKQAIPLKIFSNGKMLSGDCHIDTRTGLDKNYICKQITLVDPLGQDHYKTATIHIDPDMQINDVIYMNDKCIVIVIKKGINTIYVLYDPNKGKIKTIVMDELLLVISEQGFNNYSLVNIGLVPVSNNTNNFYHTVKAYIFDVYSLEIKPLLWLPYGLVETINNYKTGIFFNFDEILYDIPVITSQYIILRVECVWYIFNIKDKISYYYYNYNYSPAQTMVKLSNNKYLILGSGHYKTEIKNYMEGPIYFDFTTSKYTAILQLR
jgi:hypothetical protein